MKGFNFSNASPLAKLSILFGGITTVAAGFIFFGGDITKEIGGNSELSGNSKININLEKNVNDRKAQDSMIPEITFEEQQFRDLRDEYVENARQSDDSFVDRLDLDLVDSRSANYGLDPDSSNSSNNSKKDPVAYLNGLSEEEMAWLRANGFSLTGDPELDAHNAKMMLARFNRAKADEEARLRAEAERLKRLNEKNKSLSGADGFGANGLGGANGFGANGRGGMNGFGADGMGGLGANGMGGANGFGADGMGGLGANGMGGANGFGADGMGGFGANGMGGANGFGADGMGGLGANGMGGANGFGANGMNMYGVDPSKLTPEQRKLLEEQMRAQQLALETQRKEKEAALAQKKLELEMMKMEQLQALEQQRNQLISEELAKISGSNSTSKYSEAIASAVSNEKAKIGGIYVAEYSVLEKEEKNDPMSSGLGNIDRLLANADSRVGSLTPTQQSLPQEQVAQFNETATYQPVEEGEENIGPYIPTGEIFYGVLQIAINTDEISPVRAKIVQPGVLNDAVLIGTPVKTGNKVQINFTSMTLRGKEYGVSIAAIDPDTMRIGLADDVNRHIMERYMGLIASSALGGYAEALTDSKTTTRSDGSSDTETSALPDIKSQLLYSAGTVGETLIPIFEEKYNRESTILVDGANREIGLMVMSGIQL